ncbi:hypothetical protein [Macrococcoides caseolyticum]|uniref:hypothetical protein n=1 Tax=Macrococcoides caseolyticum TaxID=69966 RepID=UPI0012FE9B35|nr:hypothetical protein [Macrococcus caseolyticus]
MNDIDGNVLSDEYIKKFYDYADGKLSKAEFNEYVTHQSLASFQSIIRDYLTMLT